MLLFVYGTLDPRHAPSLVRGIVSRFSPVAQACIAAKLYSLGRYPGIVLSADPTSRVIGQVVDVPDDVTIWHALDDYEGVPEGLYRRVATAARGLDGRLYDVQVYEYAQSLEHATFIENGVWQP